MVYNYDDLGQVTSGKRYWEDGTPVAGQQFEYAFDDIGNRTSTKSGGDFSGGSLRSATYGANLLNQYTNRTVPGALDVMGIANAAATVTVNSQSTYRKGEYYQALVNVANSSTNVFQKITNVANLSGVTNQVSGGTIVPMANQTFRYDPDGNLTNDGVFTYIWDHENRLLLITNSGMAGLPAQKITITYDSQGRRIRYVAQTNNAGTFVNARFVRYVYDGWNLLAELNGTNNAVINTYVWGADLSGTLQGAGGVGGLVAVKNASLGYHAPAYDGNGNVVALVDARTGATAGNVSAGYEYGPFGEVIRVSGPAGPMNPYRFSTKYEDQELGTLYYGYRYHGSGTGQWLSRDPIQEEGGANLYGFVGNNAINRSDVLGNWYSLGPIRETINKLPGASPAATKPAMAAYGAVASTEPMSNNSLYKLANSDLSTDLVNHYFGKTKLAAGADYDVSGYGDILDYAREKVFRAIEKSHFDSFRNAVEKFSCPSTVTSPTWYTIKPVTGNGFRAVNYIANHSAIGHANMNIEYVYTARVLCKCGKDATGKVVVYPHLALMKAAYRYDFWDQFRDAADWAHQRNGDNEYIGGTRFNVVGAWDVEQKQSGIISIEP